MTWTQHALHNVVSCWVWEWNKCCCVCDTDSTTALSVIIIRCLRSVNMRHKDGIFCNFLCMLYRGLSVCVFIWASLYLYWHCIPRGLDKITLCLHLQLKSYTLLLKCTADWICTLLFFDRWMHLYVAWIYKSTVTPKSTWPLLCVICVR